MEFGTKINNQICDDNFMRFVGWEQSNQCIKAFFHQSTVDLISQKVSQLTQGVQKEGRLIIVPDKTICNVMDSVYNNRRPNVGDIHTRYIIPPSGGPQSDVQNMIDRVIEIIVSTIKNEYGMRYWNESLSIWTTVYGDFNEHGLRQHAPIKVSNRRSNRMQFNMNY